MLVLVSGKALEMRFHQDKVLCWRDLIIGTSHFLTFLSGLLRVREFTMCEIEHFVHPERKNHSRFADVAHTVLPLYSAAAQMQALGPTSLSIGEAVKSGLVDNETLGYFLVRIHSFLLRIGIDPSRIRFRQHMQNEMAHYASDCWDAEIHSSYGWIESVGCADRSAYDLTAHSRRTGVKLVARETIPERVVESLEWVVNKSAFGKRFGKEGKAVMKALEKIEGDELVEMKQKLDSDGFVTVSVEDKSVEVKGEMVSIKLITKKINGTINS